MESARPLRELFADLAGHDDGSQAHADAQSFLADHGGLPDDLLVTAIGSYAETAPAEVAEHLAPVVAAGTAGTADASSGLHLLASVPAGDWHGEVALDGDAGTASPDAHDLGDLEHFGDPDHPTALDHASELDHAGFDHGDDLSHADDLTHVGNLGSADSLDQTDHVAHPGDAAPAGQDAGSVEHAGDDGHLGFIDFNDGDTSTDLAQHEPAFDDEHTSTGDDELAHHVPADDVPVDGPHLDFNDLPDEQPEHDQPEHAAEQHAVDEPDHDAHDQHDLGDLGHFG